MNNLFRTTLCVLPAVLALVPTASNAQSLYITPPRRHINNRPYSGVETLTLDLVVDGGIASAVAWGTTITLTDTATLQFVQDFGGAGQPFRPVGSFFDTSLSDPYAANSGTLSLNYANFTPGAILGDNGQVVLGQFQVRVLREPNYPESGNFGGRITLDPLLDAPPFGSGVFDELGNNLILGAYGAAITSRPATPEPAAWLTMASGAAVGLLCLRRRGRSLTA